MSAAQRCASAPAATAAAAPEPEQEPEPNAEAEREERLRKSRARDWETTEHGRWCHYCTADDEKVATCYVAVPCGHRVACRRCCSQRPYLQLRADPEDPHSASDLIAAHGSKVGYEIIHCPFCDAPIVFLQLVRQ